MKKSLLFSTILLLVAFGLSWQIGWGATIVKNTTTLTIPTKPSTSVNLIGGVLYPDYTFFSSPDKYCSNADNIGNNHAVKSIPERLLGDGSVCTSAEYQCQAEDGSWPETSWIVENTGQSVIPTTPHTGDTVFCNSGGYTDIVACGKTYVFDPPYIGTTTFFKGNYCENDPPLGEASKRCQSYYERPDSNIDSTIYDLEAYNVTDIYEGRDNGGTKGIDSWIYNDYWDPSGGADELKSYITHLQKTPYGGGAGDEAKSVDEALKVKSDYFDKGDIVMGAIFTGTGFHGLIFTGMDYDPTSKNYTFYTVDPNYPVYQQSFPCMADADKKLVCWYRPGKPAGKIVEFFTDLTDNLKLGRTRGCPRSGDLCPSDPYLTPQQRVKNINDNMQMFKNWTTNGTPGQCGGWSEAVIKITYLANFVGDKPTTTTRAICAVSVQGEKNTSYCGGEPGDYRSPCIIDVKTESLSPLSRPITRTITSSVVCGYKTGPTPIPEQWNFLKSVFGINNVTCDGQEYEAFNPNEFPNDEDNAWRPPVKVIFKATQRVFLNPITSVPSESWAGKTWNNITTSLNSIANSVQSLLSAVVAVVYNPPKSCTYKAPVGDGYLTLTYQNGYVFSHPSHAYNDVEYQKISSTDVKEMYKLWTNDLIFGVGGGDDNIWSWSQSSNDKPSIVNNIDYLSSSYFASLVDYQKSQGIDTNCRLDKPLPPRFQEFLASVNPAYAYGLCGTATSTPSATPPTANLCLSGTPGPVGDDSQHPNQWTWSCAGKGGGQGVSCASSKINTARRVIYRSPASGSTYLNTTDKVPFSLTTAGYESDSSSKPYYLINTATNGKTIFSGGSATARVNAYASTKLNYVTSQSSSWPIQTITPGIYHWLICDTVDGNFPSTQWDKTTSGPVTNCPVQYASPDFTITAPVIPAPVRPIVVPNPSPTPPPPPTPTPITGVCGGANGGSYLQLSGTGQCARGSGSQITDTGTAFTWTCTGLNGGPTVNCQATKTIPPPPPSVPAPVCGSANGLASTSTLSTNLCASGKPSTPASSGSNWAWLCKNTAGLTVICLAPKVAPTSFIQPIDLLGNVWSTLEEIFNTKQ